MLPGSREGPAGGMLRRGRRVLAAAGMGPLERFLAYCSSTPDTEIQRVLSAEAQANLAGRRSTDADLALIEASGLLEDDAFLYRDLMVYLPNHNLQYTDKMGMAVGMETRVPLLDLDLLDTATSYPARWKFSSRATKCIMRQAARGLVPANIIRRRKAGFGAPYRKWLRYDLSTLWNDVMSEAAVKRRGWFDGAGLNDARGRSQSGGVDLYMLQWAALVIEIWRASSSTGSRRSESEGPCSRSCRTSGTASCGGDRARSRGAARAGADRECMFADLPGAEKMIMELARKSPIGKARERPDVQGFKPGDRVASDGPHAGVVCVPKHPSARVPDKVPYEHAAFTVVGAIARQGVRLAHLRLGETAFVVGLGLVGHITVGLAAILAVRSLREGVPFEIA